MENFHRIVNRFLSPAQPADPAETLAIQGFPLPRAPASGARKSGILASETTPRKHYFDKHINDA